MLYGGGPCIWGKSYDIYDGAKPLVKKYEKILEEERQAGRIKKEIVPKLSGGGGSRAKASLARDRSNSYKSGDLKYLRDYNSEVRGVGIKKGPMDDIALPPEKAGS